MDWCGIPRLHLPDRIAALDGFSAQFALFPLGDESNQDFSFPILLDVEQLTSYGIGEKVATFRIEAENQITLPH